MQYTIRQSAAGYKFELCHTTKRAPALFADWIADISEKFIKHMRFIDYVRTRINSAGPRAPRNLAFEILDER